MEPLLRNARHDEVVGLHVLEEAMLISFVAVVAKHPDGV